MQAATSTHRIADGSDKDNGPISLALGETLETLLVDGVLVPWTRREVVNPVELARLDALAAGATVAEGEAIRARGGVTPSPGGTPGGSATAPRAPIASPPSLWSRKRPEGRPAPQGAPSGRAEGAPVPARPAGGPVGPEAGDSAGSTPSPPVDLIRGTNSRWPSNPSSQAQGSGRAEGPPPPAPRAVGRRPEASDCAGSAPLGSGLPAIRMSRAERARFDVVRRHGIPPEGDEAEKERQRRKVRYRRQRALNTLLVRSLRALGKARKARHDAADRVEGCSRLFRMYRCAPPCENVKLGARPCGSCHFRLCAFCAAKRSALRAKIIEAVVEAEGGRWSFITFTTPNVAFNEGQLAASWKADMHRWQKLREQKWFKHSVDGGYFARETTVHRKGEVKRDKHGKPICDESGKPVCYARDEWHPHAHALVKARWCDKVGLDVAWQALGGGFVDIREVVEGEADGDGQKSLAGACAEIAKYVTKLDSKLLGWPEAVDELLDAMVGVRLIQPFGCCFQKDRDIEEQVDEAWEKERGEREQEEIQALGPCELCGCIAWQFERLESEEGFKVHSGRARGFPVPVKEADDG